MSDESVSQSDQDKKFQMYDIVWAKITGYPWWPAQITHVPLAQNGNYRVNFIGDYSHAFLGVQKLVDYAQWKDQYSVPKKTQHKKFYMACAVADELYEKLSERKITQQVRSVGSQEPKLKQNQLIIKPSSQINQQDNFQDQQPKKEDEDISYQYSNYQLSKRLYNSDCWPIKPRISKKLAQIDKFSKVQSLLRKYNLDKLQSKKPKPGKLYLKKKKQCSSTYQDTEQYDQKQTKMKLSKKIMKILKYRNIKQSKKKEIVAYISRQIVKENTMKLQEEETHSLRQLFNWIKGSTPEEIQSEYQSWTSK